MLRLTAVPSSLPWRLVCAALPQNLPESSATMAHSDNEASSGSTEAAVMLLRRACMHNGVAEGRQEEYAESALAFWCSSCPVHTVPPAPGAEELHPWTWACITAALRALPASLVASLEAEPAPPPDVGDATKPAQTAECMQLAHMVAVGVLSKGRALHQQLATSALQTLAAKTPGVYGGSGGECPYMEQWLAAATTCAHAVVTSADSRKHTQEVTTELLRSTRGLAEDLGDTGADPNAPMAQGSSDHEALLHKIRWQLLLVSYIAWHARLHHADGTVEVLSAASYVSLDLSLIHI